jgi:hypothetical protein
MNEKTEKQERQDDEAELSRATEDAQVTVSHEPTLEHPSSEACTDLPNRQRRDAQACASPEEVKARIKASFDREPSRPLAYLAKVEADLHARSAALARLSPSEQKRPYKDLLIHQLVRTVDTSSVEKAMAPEIRGNVVALCSALESEDPTDSMLNQLMVAMYNNVMQSHARAVQTRDPKAIDIYLRHAEKGSRAVIDLIEARAQRRGPTKVSVGNVTVKAGGRAIVGNIEARKRGRPTKETKSDPSLDNDEENSD